MYLTQRPNDVVALDAATGRVFWMYRYNNSDEIGVCCGANNRGLAILGDTLFMGTLDAHLVAIDAKNGTPVWKTKVGDSKLGYSLTVAPLAIKDRVIVGARRWRVRHSRCDCRVRRAEPGRSYGASTRFPALASRATKRGKRARRIRRPTAIPRRGRTAADRCG